MKRDAKKVILQARVEGSDQICLFQCDILDVGDNQLLAVLEWGVDAGHCGMRYVPLRAEFLRDSSRPGVEFEYLAPPVRVPADLAQLPKALTEAAFRRGCFPTE